MPFSILIPYILTIIRRLPSPTGSNADGLRLLILSLMPGNVQLRSTFTPTLELPSSGAVPKDILSAISKAERAAQESINTRLEGLADKAFKS